MKITTIDIGLAEGFTDPRRGCTRQGILWWCASLGEETWRIWAHGQADDVTIRETVCKDE